MSSIEMWSPKYTATLLKREACVSGAKLAS